MREGERNLAKKVNQDIEVTIVNNSRGSFFFDKRNGDVVLDLDGYGDENVVMFGDLKRNASKLKDAFNKFMIVIAEVDSDEFTIEDVVKELRLTDAYNELLSLSDEKLGDIDYIDISVIEDFVEDADSEDIEKILKSNKSKLIYTVTESITELYKQNRLADYNKMRLVAEKLGYEQTEHFWSAIEKE